MPKERGNARSPGCCQTEGSSRLLWGTAILSAVFMVAYIVVPMAILVASSMSVMRGQGISRDVALPALRLTLISSTVATTLAVWGGTPLAYIVARRLLRGRSLLMSIVGLPLVVPPVVAGIALLMTFGRYGPLGTLLRMAGVEVPFTPAAVVLADLFVAGPLYVESARVGFAAVPQEVEEAAVLDGATPWDVFARVALPLALPHVESGALLCWARAVSEFGATLMFAGNLPGRTQTMSLAIMTALERDLGTTLLLSVLLLGTACGIFLGVRLLAPSVSTAPP